MSAEITISLSPQTEVLAMQLEPQVFLRALARGMDKANELALGQILVKHFTGRGPFAIEDHRLGVRTNRLRKSMRRTRAIITGNQVASSMGSNVRYFGIHELGYSGTVSVRAHQRRAPQADRFDLGSGPMSRRQAAMSVDLSTSKGRKKAATYQTASGVARVRAHTRKVNLPERRPLRTGLEESASIYEQQISAALAEAWSGGAK